MKNLSASTLPLNNSFSSMVINEMLSEAQVIAWGCALASEAVVIFLSNLLTIVLFTFNKRLRNKKSLYLVMNMAFADLVWGGASLPLFVYLVLDIGYLIFYGLYIAFPLESASFFRFRYFIRLVTNCDYLRPQHRYLEKDSAKICSLLPKQTHANPAFDESTVIGVCWYLEFLDPRNYFSFVKIFRSKHIFKHSPFHLFYTFFQFFYQCNGVRIKNS